MDRWSKKWFVVAVLAFAIGLTRPPPFNIAWSKELVPQLVEVAGQFLVAEEGLEPPTRGL